ncbi:hypothetical protein TNCT_247111 [Trichonephila clavata]|uniref:Uncharacterized protein n=1 Tax=Trichonephila clavata TaxID=2740835 RepID=A0A8X6G7T9_TRICU|nr:hypothetical protein TNCT_247111 [Trichonephila clavata]
MAEMIRRITWWRPGAAAAAAAADLRQRMTRIHVVETLRAARSSSRRQRRFTEIQCGGDFAQHALLPMVAEDDY